MFKIKYSQSSEKTSTEDGFLLTSSSARWVWIKDRKGVTLNKGKVDIQKMKSIVCGNSIRLGKFHIDIVEEHKSSRSAEQAPDVLPPAPKTEVLVVDREAETGDLKAASRVLTGPVLDPDVSKKMRVHQLDAANFLLSRLLGHDVIAPDGINFDDILDANGEMLVEKGDAEQKQKQKQKQGNSANEKKAKAKAVQLPPHKLSKVYASSSLPVTGAILADDMGLGKSLTSLSVLWALVRHGRAKGVIVCPATLVGNWENEINKWMRHNLGSKTIFISPSNTSLKKKQLLNLFVTSSPSVFQLLVISYEIFQKVVDQLNRIVSWEVLICDEGHRLKNPELTQTSLKLATCSAMKRLILTGTPIQNHLDELYSLINFACPGYLGSFKEYQNNFSSGLVKSNNKSKPSKKKRKLGHDDDDNEDDDEDDEVSNEKRNRIIRKDLQLLMSKIMIRRTKQKVLLSILPKRNIYNVFCALSDMQKREYLKICDKVITNAEEQNNTTGVLPYMTELRLISVSSFPEANGENMDAEKALLGAGENDKRDSGSAIGAPTAEAESTANQAAIRELNAKSLFKRSGKFNFIDSLLYQIRGGSKKSNPPMEKVVVVSNFSDTLDDLECMAKYRNWLYLRIDGQVSTDRRTKNVRHFNDPQSPFFLMLLGARAGGVGLNLIGGSRLVMMDPDWNPATDQQAMARVWREGQTKPVTIYRLISEGTIEETILGRQHSKNALSLLLSTSNPSENSGEDAQDGSGSGSFMPVDLEKEDVQTSILPKGREGLSGTETEASTSSISAGASQKLNVPEGGFDGMMGTEDHEFVRRVKKIA